MKYELSKQQLENLAGFLNRVPLKGAEVNAFIEIANIFQNPIKEKDELPTNKKNTK